MSANTSTKIKPTLSARLKGVAWEAWLPIILVAAWWIFSARSESTYFPPFQDILRVFQEDWLFSHFWTDLVPSLTNLFFGLLIGVIGGVAIGMLLGSIKFLWMATAPLAHFMRALPTLSLIPAAMALFGIGTEQKIALIAFASFWPVLLGTIDGVRAVGFSMHDLGKTYKMPLWVRLSTIIWPSASPNILAAVRISLAIGVIMMVGSELYGASRGVGYYLIQSQRAYELPQTWAATLLLGIIGYILSVSFRKIEQSILHWHPSVRDQKGS